MIPLDKGLARRIVSHLKAGTTPIDCVEHVNVGNERWYESASELFDEIQIDGDSVVRFVNGYYGDGKTHFMGMLRSLAFSKGWAVTYVTAETTPLNKFDIVYSEIVRNITVPGQVAAPSWVVEEDGKGASALLGALFGKLYYEAYRMADPSGLKKERVLEALRYRAVELSANPGIHEAVGAAVRAYVEAMIRNDRPSAHTICAWLQGDNIRVPQAGITRRIDQKSARDILRSISLLLRRAGAGGVLMLLDEAERIMEQTRLVRNRSYGVIRDLLDNADDQGGMRSSIVYVAATPEMFTSEKGFAEYDALRSRLMTSARFALPGVVDWRGVIVDLTRTTLPHDHLLKLAERVVGIHSVAREWNAAEFFTDGILARVVSGVESGPFVVSKPRLVASCVATLLEVIEQNRDMKVADILNGTIAAVNDSLLKKPTGQLWE